MDGILSDDEGTYLKLKASMDRLRAQVDMSRIQPGQVFNLPVPFVLEDPPVFLKKIKRSFFEIIEENVWWDSKRKKFFNPEAVKTGRVRGVDIQTQGKVRPFLVIEKPALFDIKQDYAVPTWIKNCVMGFTITSVKDFEIKDAELNMALIQENRLEFLHYLPPFKNGDAAFFQHDQPSIIVISNPIPIHHMCFKQPIGRIPRRDWSEVMRKLLCCLDLS